MRTPLALAFVAALATRCTRPNPSDAGHASADEVSIDVVNTVDVVSFDVTPVDNGPIEPMGPEFCAVTSATAMAVPGAILPDGFCIRVFATVPEARTLTFASNGDLFVASPSMGAPGGASGGSGSIIVLSDDNHDGVAELNTFLDGVPDVHGLAFGPDGLYYTTTQSVYRVPYTAGERHARGPAVLAATFDTVENERWTHGLAVSHMGEMFTSQGVHSARACPDTVRAGTVTRLNGGTLSTVASGLRNPLYMRCHPTDELCLAAELGDDGGLAFGARERLIAVHQGSDFGFPCCATVDTSTPFNDGHFSCATITREEASFPLNDTPFGLDWERDRWPTPFRGSLFVALHGSFYSTPQWAGARVVFAATDATTHVPNGPFRDFLGGFGPGGSPLDRPADVAFAPDGRLFLSDDMTGGVYWIAPTTLHSSW